MGQALGAEDEHDEMQAPEEEDEPQRSIHTPATPSVEEMAELCHNSQILCRDCCPDCFEAFGRDRTHEGTDCLHQRPMPLISCGYVFVTQGGVLSRNDLPEEHATELSPSLCSIAA